jgi:hypothetical protein
MFSFVRGTAVSVSKINMTKLPRKVEMLAGEANSKHQKA